MLAIIFALISYFSWGAGDIPGTIATRKIGSILTSFWIYLVGLLGSTLFIPFFFNDLNKFTLEVFGINIGLGILLAVCYLAFNEAFRLGNVSIVGTIAGSFSAVTIVLSLIFLGETLTIVQFLFILLIFSGIILTSLNFKDLKSGTILENKGTWIALAVMFGWGAYYTFIKIPITEVGWFWPNYISAIIGTVLLGWLAFGKLRTFKVSDMKTRYNLIAAGILLTLGTFSLNYALSVGATSLVAPIAGSYTTLFVLLSRFAFKDRLTKQQWLGIVVTLCGIVLLAFFTK